MGPRAHAGREVKGPSIGLEHPLPEPLALPLVFCPHLVLCSYFPCLLLTGLPQPPGFLPFAALLDHDSQSPKDSAVSHEPLPGPASLSSQELVSRFVLGHMWDPG